MHCHLSSTDGENLCTVRYSNSSVNEMTCSLPILLLPTFALNAGPMPWAYATLFFFQWLPWASLWKLLVHVLFFSSQYTIQNVK